MTPHTPSWSHRLLHRLGLQVCESCEHIGRPARFYDSSTCWDCFNEMMHWLHERGAVVCWPQAEPQGSTIPMIPPEQIEHWYAAWKEVLPL